MELTDEVFKEFRTFLKINGLYKDFMDNFRAQRHSVRGDCSAYQSYGDKWSTLTNYKDVMRGYSSSKSNNYKNFGAMILTFASFNWANGGCVPIDFTRKWCTVGVKWGLYCINKGINIGGDNNYEFKRLLSYWNGMSWIDPYLLSKDERTMLKNMFGIMRINEVYIDDI
jgi:hypothetical protein